MIPSHDPFAPGDSFVKMPKVELHRHLEGSIRLETLISIAIAHNITLPSYQIDDLRPFVQIMPDDPRSSQGFLSKFATLRQFYRSAEVIRRVTTEAVADAAADGVRYMELRFTPQALNNLMRCEYEEVVGWVCDAAASAAAEHDILVALILSMNRHESVAIGERVVQIAVDHRDRGVVGIDLAGQEVGHPAQPFAALFAEAKRAGLGITVHAGEWAGASSVRDAVEVLNADRIGHGIRAIEDADVIALLCERGVVLEVCPTSNVHSGVVADYDRHPLPALIAAGVRTTINTDDPLISNITLSDELRIARDHVGIDADDLRRCLLNAAGAAFLTRASAYTHFILDFQHRLIGDNLTRDNVTEVNLPGDNLPEDNVTEDNVTEDNVMEDNTP